MRNRLVILLLVALLTPAVSAAGIPGSSQPVDLQARGSHLQKPTGGGRVDLIVVEAAEFFSACPTVAVRIDTQVIGDAVVAGDCTVDLGRGVDVDFLDTTLDLGNIQFRGVAESSVTFGAENCDDGGVCAGADVSAASLDATLNGANTRVRAFNTTIDADSVVFSATGTDARARVHTSTINASGMIRIEAAGADARALVRVENELLQRNSLNGSSVVIASTGSDCETRLEDTDFVASTVDASSDGELRSRRNNFGMAGISQSGGDDCESKDNTPDIDCD